MMSDQYPSPQEIRIKELEAQVQYLTEQVDALRAAIFHVHDYIELIGEARTLSVEEADRRANEWGDKLDEISLKLIKER